MYALIPIGAAFIVHGRSLRDLRDNQIFMIKAALGFVGIAVLMAALFHTHAVLNPAQFLEKQASIRAFHSTMYKPLGESSLNWLVLLISNEYWILLAIVAAGVQLTVNRFRGDAQAKLFDMVCLTMVLTAALFVAELRFCFLRAYIYPFLPLALFSLISTWQGWARNFPTRWVLCWCRSCPFTPSIQRGPWHAISCWTAQSTSGCSSN